VQTAYTTASLLFHLAKNPDKQQKLFEEIQRYVPDKNQPITSDILNELKYLKACIKESMRSVTSLCCTLTRLRREWNTEVLNLPNVASFYLYVQTEFWI